MYICCNVIYLLSCFLGGFFVLFFVVVAVVVLVIVLFKLSYNMY